MITLVKIDSKDKLRVFNIWTEGPTVKRTAGVLGGNLVPSEKDAKPKNVNRANATTAEEQAILEMTSEINKKKDETYVEIPSDLLTKNEIEIRSYVQDNTPKIPQAMLAKAYSEKYADYSTLGVLVSPKLDGMRCLAVVPAEGEIVLWSRGSKRIETMGHIQKELEILRPLEGQLIFDGELYLHDKESDNFQENMKAIKKYREGFSEQVKYYVYDMVHPDDTAWTRCNDYVNLLYNKDLTSVVALGQVIVRNFDEVLKHHQQFLNDGYEGTMIKNLKSLYRQKARSSDLLKLKDFHDEEFEVVDIIPMENKPEFGLAVLKLGDETFKATPKMNHDERRQLLVDREKYIGGAGTVTYFEKSADGIPRFPVLKSITVSGELEDFRV